MRIEIVVDGEFIVVDEESREKVNAFFARHGLDWVVSDTRKGAK